MRKIITTVTLLFTVFTAGAQTWNIGTPNAADVTATLSNDTLYIRGTGEMQDFPAMPHPWSNINHAVIEAGVTSIGNNAFQNCFTLTSIKIPEGITSIKIASFRGCFALTSIIIPESVTNIDDYAFWACTALTSVVISKSVTSIGDDAFFYCTNLNTITNLNPIPQVINANVFDSAPIGNTTLIVPCGSLYDYKQAPVWQDFGEIIEECPKPGVTNVSATFACPGGVTVNYDLNTTDPTDVMLYYSPDGGKTWLTAQTVTGDLTAQTSGNGKTIVWDNRADRVSMGRFKLRVDVPKKEPLECVEINGVCWATRNVDAPGTFVENPEDYGMFYQWNSNVGWSSTNPITSTNGSTWNRSWHGNGATTWETTNDVCPSGWRIPTKAELESLLEVSIQLITRNGINGREFSDGSNSIFLPAAGYLDYHDGTISSAGIYAAYWALSTDFLYFNPNIIDMSYDDLNFGQSVRCVIE